jgi:hypothetical protein
MDCGPEGTARVRDEFMNQRDALIPNHGCGGFAISAGMPEEIGDRMLDLERNYREGHASRITNDIQQVTGHAPKRFAQYARDCASSLQSA